MKRDHDPTTRLGSKVRPWVGGLLTLLILGGCASRPINEPLEQVDSARGAGEALRTLAEFQGLLESYHGTGTD